jgi:putative aminopeptidase FrvX
MPADVEFLRALCVAPGPSGFEEPAQEVVRQRVASFASPQIDVLGNLIAEVNPGGAPHVVVNGHVDQIGLQVTWIDERGFVFFDKVGSIDPLLLPGRFMIVHSAGGPVAGVVGKKPTHMITEADRGKAAEIHDQWLDIGARGRDEALARIAIGDPITFAANFAELAPGFVTSQAMDDRCGVYVAFRALELYAEAPGAARMSALSTVQEETRFGGALGQARLLAPECMIVIDGDFATDQPEVTPAKAQGAAVLGGGPVLGRGGASNPRLYALAIEVAGAEGIPVQSKAYPGDTQTDNEVLQFSGGGTAALNIGIPMRYMHSPHEVAHLDDLEWSARLLAALTRRIGDVFEPGCFIPGV